MPNFNWGKGVGRLKCLTYNLPHPHICFWNSPNVTPDHIEELFQTCFYSCMLLNISYSTVLILFDIYDMPATYFAEMCW